jgi:hypothetical protein
MAFSVVLGWMVGVMAVSPVLGQNGRPTQRQSPPWVLDGRSVMTITPPAAIRAVAQEFDALRAGSFKGVAARLNDDEIDDYIFQGEPQSCGTGGCTYVIIDGAGATPIGLLFGNPLVLRAESTRGFLNIDLYSHASATSGTFTSYAFDGNKYVERSTRHLTGAAVTALFADLNRLPRWRAAQ